jgi:hypothetical protein
LLTLALKFFVWVLSLRIRPSLLPFLMWFLLSCFSSWLFLVFFFVLVGFPGLLSICFLPPVSMFSFFFWPHRAVFVKHFRETAVRGTCNSSKVIFEQLTFEQLISSNSSSSNCIQAIYLDSFLLIDLCSPLQFAHFAGIVFSFWHSNVG